MNSQNLPDILPDSLPNFCDPFTNLPLDKVAKLIKNEQVSKLRFNYPIPAYAQEALKMQLAEQFNLPAYFEITWRVVSHQIAPQIQAIPGIKNIIAVGSGKGGVGKSSVAVNLALALNQLGAKVGLLDADIYGPTQPRMLGITGRAEISEHKKIMPIEKYGIKTMSIGYLIDSDTPAIWRGPMVSSALQQLLFETIWGELDYLILDLPPGTGDTQLTMAQKFPLSGAVIVTTPQDVAVSAAEKGLNMFKKVGVPVLGVVENMSYHVCSNCQHQDYLFGAQGGKKMADRAQVPLLGALPYDMSIGQDLDSGNPTVIKSPNSRVSKLYQELAVKLAAQLALQPVNLRAGIPVVLTPEASI
jgi:ATP-binding protein involved in chromosome partitioning